MIGLRTAITVHALSSEKEQGETTPGEETEERREDTRAARVVGAACEEVNETTRQGRPAMRAQRMRSGERHRRAWLGARRVAACVACVEGAGASARDT
jgi:hypothetical protein